MFSCVLVGDDGEVEGKRQRQCRHRCGGGESMSISSVSLKLT